MSVKLSTSKGSPASAEMTSEQHFYILRPEVRPHLHWDWARPAATSAPGLGSPLCHIGAGTGARPADNGRPYPWLAATAAYIYPAARGARNRLGLADAESAGHRELYGLVPHDWEPPVP